MRRTLRALARITAQRLYTCEIPILLLEEHDPPAFHLFSIEERRVACTLTLPSPAPGCPSRILTPPVLGGPSFFECFPVVCCLPPLPPVEREEGEEEEEAAPAEGGGGEEGGEAKTSVHTFRLVDMLQGAHPAMMKNRPGAFIQTYGKEEYLTATAPFLSTLAGDSVTMQFMNDAQKAAFGTDLNWGAGSPRGRNMSPRSSRPPVVASRDSALVRK
ncbi:hypothetical protein T484DRAFT_1788761 [Baffinella frigidus]|nr:hypothetical protein T484DRAFT_1788761 [Cryptophyta sp. CCMP2293]